MCDAICYKLKCNNCYEHDDEEVKYLKDLAENIELEKADMKIDEMRGK